MCPFDLAVLIVNYPFPINDFIRPACLPPILWSWNLKGGNMVISGMGKTPTSYEWSPSYGRSLNMQIATIPMKSKRECYDNLNAIRNTKYDIKYDAFRGEIVVL